VSKIPSERIWIYRTIFTTLSVFVILTNLIPLQTTPQAWPWPNILLLIIFCWSLREPNFVPVPLVAVILLLQDLLLHRPTWIIIRHNYYCPNLDKNYYS
jgi:rod shape-determining protein MreD